MKSLTVKIISGHNANFFPGYYGFAQWKLYDLLILNIWFTSTSLLFCLRTEKKKELVVKCSH